MRGVGIGSGALSSGLLTREAQAEPQAAGKGMGEHKVLTGNNSGFGDSPAQAQQRIAALRSDPVWAKAYLNGDKDKLAEMTRLNAIAYPSS